MIAVLVIYVGLVLARVGAFVTVVPLLGGQPMPRMVKAGLALALTVLWASTFCDRLTVPPWVREGGTIPWLGVGLAVGKEMLLGGVVGFAFSLFLVPARVAGEFISQEMGLSFGNQVQGAAMGESTPLTMILEMMAAAIFFGLDGHHAFLSVLHGTFEQYPVGQGLPTLPLGGLVHGITATQEWGLSLAAPVALCLFITTVVMTLLARATPQLNLYTVGFPLRMGAGLVAVLLLLPQSVTAMVSIAGQFTDYLGRLF